MADGGNVIAVTTHRGLVRSADGGKTWANVEGALPSHLECGPLVQDPRDANTFYVGFALRPFNEPWNAAQQTSEQIRSSAMQKRWLMITGAGIVGALLIWLMLRKKNKPPSGAIT